MDARTNKPKLKKKKKRKWKRKKTIKKPLRNIEKLELHNVFELAR